MNITTCTESLFFLLTIVGSAWTQESDEPIVESLVRGNRATYESFSILTIKFRVTRAFARDLDAGMRGEWLQSPPPLVCNSFRAVDGDNVRRDDVYDAEQVEKLRKEKQLYWGDLKTRYAISNTTLEASYDPGQVFHIGSKSEASLTGWDPLVPAKLLPFYREADSKVTKPQREVRYLGEKNLAGKPLPVIEIEITTTHAKQFDHYWIDPDRGYFPVRVETYTHTTESFAQVAVVQELRELSGGRWLPTLYRYVNVATAPAVDSVACVEVAVDEIDADNRPKADLFSIHVPVGLNGVNRVTGAGVTSKTGRVSLSAFQNDGALREDQVDLDLLPGASISSGPPSAQLLTPSSDVPQWPFAGPAKKRLWSWLFLFVGLGAAAIWLVRRRYAK